MRRRQPAGGSSAVKDKSGKVQRQEDAGDEEETYYDAMKKELAGRATRTKAALDALDCQQRIAMEGFRPGTYLRLHFRGLLHRLPVVALNSTVVS